MHHKYFKKPLITYYVPFFIFKIIRVSEVTSVERNMCVSKTNA